MRVACALLAVLCWSAAATAQVSPAVVVTGTVVDQVGAAVGGAPVTLTSADGATTRQTTADGQGVFSFADVARGSYVVRIEVAGFTPFSSGPVAVTGDAPLLPLPRIVLTVEGFSTSVTVRSTEAVADEQIAAQEQQRFLSVVPNFYVSYVPDAAPMTSRQKLALATRQTFDWTAFVGASIAAGIDQSTGAHPGFGDGASGYAKRWAANFVDNRTGDMLSHYVFASLLHQDPRYFYQGTGTTSSRLVHALGSAFVARGDDGRRMPNYSYVLGNFAAAALSNTYYPHSERGGSLVLSNIAFGLAGRAVVAVTQEFIGKRLTTRVPAGN